MKILRFILCFLAFLFSSVGYIYALDADEAFIDIERDYEYYNELQYLLDE